MGQRPCLIGKSRPEKDYVYVLDYVTDQPQIVIPRRTKRTPRPTTLSTLPWPSSESRVSASTHTSEITTTTTPHARASGIPGWLRITLKKCSDGCPAGTHVGINGVTPATSENVRSLRVSQPRTLGLREPRSTMKSHTRSPMASGTQPYSAILSSSQNQIRNINWAWCPSTWRGSRNHATSELQAKASISVVRPISCSQCRVAAAPQRVQIDCLGKKLSPHRSQNILCLPGRAARCFRESVRETRHRNLLAVSLVFAQVNWNAGETREKTSDEASGAEAHFSSGLTAGLPFLLRVKSPALPGRSASFRCWRRGRQRERVRSEPST